MKVLITGSSGQLGAELVATAPPGFDVYAFGRAQLDIRDDRQVLAAFDEVRPDLLLNAAAFTAVDGAESDPVTAWAVNHTAVAALARRCERSGCRLIHISTDFVFDGTATQPYPPTAETNPLSEYGASKLAGESDVVSMPGGTVVRTSRVYAGRGTNFVTIMLGAMREQKELRVVDDQTGSPTWSRGLAAVVWGLGDRTDLSGLWHWSDAGPCTWYEWAVEIQDRAIERGLVESTVPISPISTAEYPTPATRPKYSVLDSTATVSALGREQTPWREALGSMLDDMTTPGFA